MFFNKCYRFLTVIMLVAFTTTTSISATEELSLEKCVSLALEESEAIKASSMSAAMAGYDVDSTLISAFPSMSVDAQVLKLDFGDVTPLEFGGTVIPMEMPEYANQISISLVQPISQLYAIHKGYGIKKQLAEIELLKIDATKNQIVVRTIEYYYNYQLLRRLELLFNDISSQLNNYTQQTEAFVENGVLEKDALYKIEVERSRNTKNIEQVKSNREVLKKALSLLMNRDIDSFELTPEEEGDFSLVRPLAELLQIQKEHRPEMKMLPHAQIVAEKAHALAWQPFIPSLAFIASYTKKFDPPIMNAGNNYVLGAVLSWDVGLDWWKNSLHLEKAAAAEQKTLLENIEARKQMDLQVSQLYSNLQVKEKEIMLARAEIGSAEEVLRVEENKYQQNMTTQTDLLNAALSLKAAKTGFISAQMEYRKMLELLATIIGTKKDKITK